MQEIAFCAKLGRSKNDGRFIWPEGYTAVRKFPSIADPSVYTLYKMEVLKCNDAGPKTQPLFRVTLDNGKQWDALENNSALILYGGGAIFAIWLSSVIVDSINSVPLLPKIMELVGLGYTGWFVYRYLLFKIWVRFVIYYCMNLSSSDLTREIAPALFGLKSLKYLDL
ncbi:hypothetical protein LOK49_LG09G02076 [Camellia lanceoleosa]|uniref:Uncharacterized protein n=1 Tax=Camellia lanceoleosa TaxID=1840588 RepID=A0ACC0GI00_9ERIC|nr:hypothetical protein LOK49_LG09G02076 [Camellia lanceoleosa]